MDRLPEIETSLLDVYRDLIAKASWTSYFQNVVFTDARWNEELPVMCNAALLSKDAVKATAFLESVCACSANFNLLPEMRSTLQSTSERLHQVQEQGGWLPIQEEQSESDIEPIFPFDTFPPELECYFDNVAKNYQVRREMVFPAALASISLCVQGKYKVEYPDSTKYRQHLNLYIGIVAEPSERKSPIFQSVIKKPFFRWYDSVKERYQEEMARYKAERKVLQKQIEVAEKGCTKPEKTCNVVEDMAGLQAALDSLQKPINPYFLFDDTTPEALFIGLIETGEIGGIFSEEGDFMETMMGRYAEGGKSANAELLLKAHDGETIRSNRISRGEQILNRPLLSVCLMLQPELYNRILADKTLQGRGAIARFMFCSPQKTAGKRRAINNEPCDLTGYAAYERLLHSFLNQEQQPDEKIPILQFDPIQKIESSEIGVYLQWIENSMDTGGMMEQQNAYAGKAAGKFVRIAGLLHLLWGYDEHTKISVETARKAIQVHQFFFGEKIKEMQTIENSERKLLQRVKVALIRYTIQQGKASISKSEFYQKMKGRDITSTEQFTCILDSLENQNILQSVKYRNRTTLFASPFLIS